MVVAVCSPEQELPAAMPDCGWVAHVPPTPTRPTAASESDFTLISSVVAGALLEEPELLFEPEPLVPELLLFEPLLLFDELPPDCPVHFAE